MLGAFLLGATGYFGVFLLNGIAFLFSAFSETFIRFPKVVRDEGNGEKLHPTRQFVFSFKEGFTYIWQNGGLRAIILFALVLNFLAAPLYNVCLLYTSHPLACLPRLKRGNGLTAHATGVGGLG